MRGFGRKRPYGAAAAVRAAGRTAAAGALRPTPQLPSRPGEVPGAAPSSTPNRHLIRKFIKPKTCMQAEAQPPVPSNSTRRSFTAR